MIILFVTGYRRNSFVVRGNKNKIVPNSFIHLIRGSDIMMVICHNSSVHCSRLDTM